MSGNNRIQTNPSNKLTARDAMNVGIFTVLYQVIAVIAGCIGFLPVLFPLVPLVVGILCGPVFVLFFTKVKRFGLITAMAVLNGLVLTLTGHGIYSLLCGIVFGLLSDWLCFRGNYRSFKYMKWGYVVFTMLIYGSFMPMFLSAESYYAQLQQKTSAEYVEKLRSLMQLRIVPIFLIAAVVGGMIGAYLGRAVLKKHFQRAGVAG